ncbi:lipopolysaccharide biosynthesis protein [Pedobacter sp. Leaf194]|uniref:lipopolysaccharide biosynthesis protein n=1 Tax=Pedobacter sp. Leaf194 TaxID=1736297 RepID=UPI000702B957|nr:lipopolysaccharide biosynthesis protein [Pedobacter sp. Leaf194]KQS37789.1 capsule biosynthesis protein CapK [Pedobacter sp. Leaf194]
MSLRKQALSGIVWTYSQQFGGQLVTFLVSLILSRVLIPEEFGLVGMLTVFVGIGTVLFDGGLTSSLIRTKELDAADYSTVFYFNFACSVLIYLILYISAPFIADFYHQPQLELIARIYGLTFIITAFGAVQNTILTKELKFRKQALITISSLIISSTCGITLAFLKYGVWSLVIMAVVNAFINSLLLWLTTGWYPIRVFDREKFNNHFHYGYKLTLSGILDIIFTNIYQIIIGRVYSPTQVGYYARANSLMMLPVGNISGALNRVVFPIFSKIQDDIPKLKAAYKKIMLMVLFIITPAIVFMAVLAQPLIIFLFSEKWLKMVPIFQIICLTGVLYPIHMYNLIILQVVGKSDLFLKLEVFKKIIVVIILPISLYFGFYGLLWGQLISSVLALFINTHYAGKILTYSMFAQLKDLLPVFLFALISGLIIYLIDRQLIEQSNIIRLATGSILGLSTYILISWAFKFESLADIRNFILKK